jgi:uncharacterized membrane protein YdjX (TVP38/TMEM64 family)
VAAKSGLARVIILAAVVLALFALAYFLDAARYLREALDWIRDQGAVGVVVFVALYIIATVVAVPGSILTLGAGVVYGVLLGTVWVSIASTLGATAAFLVGRYVARGAVAARVEGNARFAAIDDAVGREGWKIVGLTRLSPIFPFNLLNYAYGLTKVTLRDYFFASWIGMLPGTIMYVYIGSVIGDLATIGGGERSRSVAEWVLYGVGLVATLAVTVFVTRLARKALKERIEKTGEPAASSGSDGP